MLELRNSKTTPLANGDLKFESSLAPLQFRENGKEWQDIDTNIIDGKVRKCWYDLDVNLSTPSISVMDKRTGDIVSLELRDISPSQLKEPTIIGNRIKWSNVAPDLDLEVIAMKQRVVFKRILKSANATDRAEFKITKNKEIPSLPLQHLARDADGRILPVISSIDSGILTESLTSRVGLKYPVEIDPTVDISVSASTDDVAVCWTGAIWKIQVGLAWAWLIAGYSTAADLKYGSGMRFQNVAIPRGVTITTAYLTFYCISSNANVVVNSRITGNDVDDAAVWSDIANYQARRGTIVGGANNNFITTAQVDWDAIGAWTAGNPYTSPSIVSIIQEITSRVGWANGNALALWWDDHDARGTQAAATWRAASSWDDVVYDPPKLTVIYTPFTQAVWDFFTWK